VEEKKENHTGSTAASGSPESHKVDVAHITGVQGIQAMMYRLADEEADIDLPTQPEELERQVRTCPRCAATVEGNSEACWNCGVVLP
jgi:hypothetical protein